MRGFLLLVTLMLSCQGIQSQNIEEYVKKNSYIINLDESPFDQLARFDNLFQNSKFFFFVDGHQFNSDVLIQWFFLEYLYNIANVKNYIIERGPAEAYALNKYVVEGDSSFLKYTTDAFLGLQSRKMFYQKVFEFNESKPEKDKIKFYAFDHDVINNTALLKRIIQRPDKVPSTINPMLTKIHLSDEQQNHRENYLNLLEDLQKDISEHLEDYKKYLKEDFVIVQRIATNPIINKRNETRLFESFKKLFYEGQFQDGNFACQYGFGHAILNNSKLLGGKLNKFFQQKVISFLPYYINSAGRYGKEENYYESWGASIYGKSNFRNDKFATRAAKVSNAPYVLIDLRYLPTSIIGKKELASQFLIIFTESEAIH